MLKRLAPGVAMIGTFSGPISQWILFWALAGVGGAGAAGYFAVIVAIATPIFTATNLGLRNGYITLRERASYANFVTLRLLTSLAGAAVLALFGFFVTGDWGILIAVIAFKVGDAILDILFAWLQREGRILAFGVLMVTNGTLTVGAAVTFFLIDASPTLVVASSALGSWVALVCGVAYVKTVWRSIGAPTAVTKPTLNAMARIVALCWKIALGQVLAVLLVNLPLLFVGAHGSSADSGRFAAAAYMITVGSLVGSSLNATMIGEFRSIVSEMTLTHLSRIALRRTYWITAIGMLGVGLVAISGTQLFSLLYGQEFTFTALELTVVALAAAFNPGTQVLNAALLAANQYGRQLLVYGVAAVTSILAGLLLLGSSIHPFMAGAAIALLGSVMKFAISTTSTYKVRG